MIAGGGTDFGSAMTEGGTDRLAVAVALAKAGALVLFVDPASKVPLDLRSDVQRRKDDTAERERTGNPGATAPAGRHLATDNTTLLERYWARAEKNGLVPNLAVSLGEPGGDHRVRLALVDADTADEVVGVQALALPDNPEAFTLTTRSPGQRDSSGGWIHKDGGHYVFVVDIGAPFVDEFTLPGGAVVSTHGRYFLVPPSARPEGAYVNVGPVRTLSSAPWLADVLREQSEQNGAAAEDRQTRAIARAERREAGEDHLGTTIAAWNDSHSWGSLLLAAGWEENRTGKNGRPLSRQRLDACGCPTWTAPGEHADGKSATAHDDGCTTDRVEIEGGSGPLHVWTSTRPAGLENLSRTRWTKAQFAAAVWHGGDLAVFATAVGLVIGAHDLDASEFEIDAVGAPSTDPHDPALLAEVFGYSTLLTHVLVQARARMVGPWSSLLVALVHATVLTPWQVRLPAIVGGDASVNMLAALVGGSGAGKGASTGSAPMLTWAPDPLNDHPALVGTGQSADAALSPITVGSGEAIATLYRDWRTLEVPGEDGKIRKTLSLVTVRHTAWLDFPEVDQVAALMRRESSTLSAELRKLWDGRQLGVHTKSKERRSEVPSFTYRAAVTIGVQPERAEALLSGEDGGLPQRLVWAATTDPGLGDEDDTPLASFPVTPPSWRLDGDKPVWMDVAASVRAEIRDGRRRVQRGEPGALTGLDAHRNLVRLKLAAAVAVLHSRTGVTEDDWRLAGLILTHSDRVRGEVRRSLATASTAAHEARGAADAARERGARRTRDDEIDKAAASVHSWLANRRGRSFTIREIQAAAKSGSPRRLYTAEAIETLTVDGAVREGGASRVDTPTYEWNSDREVRS